MSGAKVNLEKETQRQKRIFEMATPAARERAAKKRKVAKEIERRRFSMNYRKMGTKEVGLLYSDNNEIRKRKAHKTLTHKIGPAWRDN